MGDDAAVIFKDKQSGHCAINKITVMADDDDGALIIGDDLLQQFERFHIEIIGRLVKHQHIVFLGKEFGQQQPVLLTA